MTSTRAKYAQYDARINAALALQRPRQEAQMSSVHIYRVEIKGPTTTDSYDEAVIAAARAIEQALLDAPMPEGFRTHAAEFVKEVPA
jgi:hypothetical protein